VSGLQAAERASAGAKLHRGEAFVKSLVVLVSQSEVAGKEAEDDSDEAGHGYRAE
jgi:hypothetical protein